VQQVSGTTVDLHAVNFDHSTAARAWVCGEAGTILYTANGGATWQRQDSGTTADLFGIAFHEENGCVIAVGAGGTILRSTNNGTTWTLVPAPTTQTLHDISDFRFYAVGDSGTILKSPDGGLNWTRIESGSDANLRSVIGLEPLPTAAGEGGTILRGNPPGTAWQPLASGTTSTLHGVPLFASNFIVGDGGVILKSTTSGASWFAVASGTQQSLRSIGDANGAIYVAGAHGTILKSTDNGASWGHQATPTDHDLNGVFFYLFAHEGYAVGDAGTILKTSDGGGPIVTALPWADDGPDAGPNPGLACTPNPFRGSTQVIYQLAHAGHVSLRIFDVRGREVGRLVDARRSAGTHRALWQAEHTPAGVYVLQWSAGRQHATARVVRLGARP
jgi:photosystem II stability/assembly factor-like uncharacterized protein